MQRDLGLCRQILAEVEDGECGYIPIATHLVYHTLQLADAGLVADTCGNNRYSITSAGRDFLDAARDDEIWDEAVAMAQTVGGVTLQMMQEICVALARRRAERASELQIDDKPMREIVDHFARELDEFASARLVPRQPVEGCLRFVLGKLPDLLGNLIKVVNDPAVGAGPLPGQLQGVRIVVDEDAHRDATRRAQDLVADAIDRKEKAFFAEVVIDHGDGSSISRGPADT